MPRATLGGSNALLGGWGWGGVHHDMSNMTHDEGQYTHGSAYVLHALMPA